MLYNISLQKPTQANVAPMVTSLIDHLTSMCYNRRVVIFSLCPATRPHRKYNRFIPVSSKQLSVTDGRSHTQSSDHLLRSSLRYM